jgi:steroid 5-alpha reductase family enzyme
MGRAVGRPTVSRRQIDVVWTIELVVVAVFVALLVTMTSVAA